MGNEPGSLRQIDAGLVPHRELDSAGNVSREPDLQAELVEVHVARVLDRALEIERAVAFFFQQRKYRLPN